jgi:hypothetical protein
MNAFDYISKDTLSIALAVLIVVVLLIAQKRIIHYILVIFGGKIDKLEFSGVIFMIMFAWMVYKEGTRDHEWHLFNELYIFVVAGAALTGLGLKHAFDGIRKIRSIGTDYQETETTKVTTTKETKSDEPETP